MEGFLHGVPLKGPEEMWGLEGVPIEDCFWGNIQGLSCRFEL